MTDNEFKRILVIHFGQLGDVVLGLPAMRAIREHFPASQLTVMTGKPASEVVRLARVADDVIEVDRVELRDGNPFRSITKILQLVSCVRSHRFDLVVDLHSLAETNLLGFLARIPHRLYANRENRSLDRLSNFEPKPPEEDKSLHVSERYLDVLKPLGIDEGPRPFTFGASALENELGRVGASLALEAFIGIFPGAGHPSRCWHFSNFAELARRLTAMGEDVVLFLGPEEANLRPQIASSFPCEVRVIEGLSLTQFIAAVSKVRAFICNDTGPMHLAACTGVPVVLLMDERAPETYLPLTEKLTIVRHGRLDEIGVDEVFEATIGALRRDYDKPSVA